MTGRRGTLCLILNCIVFLKPQKRNVLGVGVMIEAPIGLGTYCVGKILSVNMRKQTALFAAFLAQRTSASFEGNVER